MVEILSYVSFDSVYSCSILSITNTKFKAIVTFRVISAAR